MHLIGKEFFLNKKFKDYSWGSNWQEVKTGPGNSLVAIIPWHSLYALQWHHNEHDGISNHQPHDCLFSLYSGTDQRKKSKLCITGLSEGNSLVTSEFLTQRASNGEDVSIWWCHHGTDQPTSSWQLLKTWEPGLQQPLCWLDYSYTVTWP